MFRRKGDNKIKQGDTLKLSVELSARDRLSIDHVMINIHSNSGDVVAQALPDASPIAKGANLIDT